MTEACARCLRLFCEASTTGDHTSLTPHIDNTASPKSCNGCPLLSEWLGGIWIGMTSIGCAGGASEEAEVTSCVVLPHLFPVSNLRASASRCQSTTAASNFLISPWVSPYRARRDNSSRNLVRHRSISTWYVGYALQRLPIRLWMASFRGSPSSLQWERVPVTVSRPLLSFLIPSRRAITHEAIPHLHGLAGTSALVWSRPDECLGSGCGFGSPDDQMP